MADIDRLIRFFHMHRIRIRLRIDGNRTHTHLFGRMHNTQRNFATIGNQHTIKHGKTLIDSSATWPSTLLTLFLHLAMSGSKTLQ